MQSGYECVIRQSNPGQLWCLGKNNEKHHAISHLTSGSGSANTEGRPQQLTSGNWEFFSVKANWSELKSIFWRKDTLSYKIMSLFNTSECFETMCIIEYYKNGLHCPFNWFWGNPKFGKAFIAGCFVLACLVAFSTVTLLTTVIAFPSLIPLNSGTQHVGRYSTDCFSMIVPLMVVILTGFFPNNHFPFHQSYGTSSHTHLLLTSMFNKYMSR